ncbi:MAG TPA: TonB-dependent receptor plug domain-containing protein [Fibrobacteria bacterium]|nr:TonB-dependent receptor plug domain-containing protein [Fibrobacteria bacterium]
MFRIVPSMLLIVPALALAQVDSVDRPMDSVAAPREAHLEQRVVRAVSERSGVGSIGREELAGAPSLAAVLDHQSGVQVRRAGGLGSYTTASLHASPAQQVEVWMDGVPLGGSTGSKVDLGPFPLEGLERVEIRQAGSTGAFGSPRIDLVSRSGWTQRGASLRLASYGERGVSGWWGDDEGRATVSAWWESARNDYPFPWDNGTRYNTADDRQVRLSNNDYEGRGAALSWRPTESVDVSARVDDSRRGISAPGWVDPAARLEGTSAQGFLRWVGDWDWKPSVEGSGKWDASVWSDPNRTAGWNVDRSADETAWDLAARVAVARDRGDWADVEVAGKTRWETSDRQSTGNAAVAVTPSGNRRTLGLLGIWNGRSASSRWGAQVGASTDWIVDSRDWAESLGDVSRIEPLETPWESHRVHGRLWGRPAGSLETWISASVRQRAPDFREWMGDNGFTLQTPDLSSELSISREIGLKILVDGWTGEAAGWFQTYRDPIEAYQKGASPLVAHRNAAGYEAFGIDARLGWEKDPFRAAAQGTLQDAAVSDGNPSLDGKRPVRFPAWKASVDASAGPWRGWRAGTGLALEGATYASELNRATDLRDGKVDMGAWIRWSRGAVSATVQADNLFDEHAEDWEDLPQPGRRYSVRLDFEFSKPTKTREER